MNAPMTDLIDRCAAHGWTLRQDGDGYELLGNGAPAAFRSEESVRVWLDKQRNPKTRDERQLTMFKEYPLPR